MFKKKSKEPTVFVEEDIPPLPTLDTISTTEEAIANVTKLLADEEKRSMITRLSDSEIKACASELTLAEVFDDKVSSKYVKHFLLHRISLGGEGRKEIIDVTKGHLQAQHETLKNRFMRFFGRQPL